MGFHVEKDSEYLHVQKSFRDCCVLEDSQKLLSRSKVAPVRVPKDVGWLLPRGPSPRSLGNKET